MFEIEGKVALITGAASGIGLSIAKILLQNGLKGAAIIDINEDLGLKVLEELKNEFGDNKVLFRVVDVSDKLQFEEAFKTAIRTFQNLDIVINCAGIVNEENWDREIAVNFNGTVNGTVLAFENYLRKYKSGPEGVILNVASIAAIRFSPGVPIYTATKCAVVGLTRAFGSKEHYERTNIKVIAVCPGLTDTGMTNSENTGLYLGPIYLNNFKEETAKDIKQTSAFVAKAMSAMIEHSTSGSVWVVKNNEPPHQVDFSTFSALQGTNT